MDASIALRGCVPYRHLWSARELDAAELNALLVSSRRMPELLAAGVRPLQGRHMAELGHPQRARVFSDALEVLGARVSCICTPESDRTDEMETAKAARLLGRLYDLIDCCGVPQAYVESLDAQAGVPVLNGIAEDSHPLRGIATLLAMQAWSGRPLKGLTLTLPRGTAPGSSDLLRLARLAGVRVQDRPDATRASRFGADEVTHGRQHEADFSFETSSSDPPALHARGASCSEQARLAALVSSQRQNALQALVLSALP